MTINLVYNAESSGIKQYYYSSNAFDKLLSQVTSARNEELGRLAAFEYE